METKPTLENIQQAYQKAIERYKGLRAIQQEHLEYYNCKYAARTGQKVGRGIVHHVLPPIAQEIITPGVNMMALDSLVVHCPPAQKAPKGLETESAKSEADAKEKWLQTLIDDLADIQPYPVEQAAFFYVLFGEAFLQTEFDWDFNLPEKGYEGNPFSIKAPDPTSIYTTFDLDAYSRPAWLYQKKVMLAGQARQLLASWLGKKYKDLWVGTKDYEQVFWVEWWQSLWRGIITGTKEDNISNWQLVPLTSDKEVIVENKLGWVPFVRLLGGKGFFATEDEPEKVVRGVLRGYETLIVQLAREMSKVDTISSYFAAPLPNITFENEETKKAWEAANANFVFGPGVMVKSVKGQYTFAWERAPGVPEGVLANLNQINAQFEKAFPGVVQGEVSPGEPAASSLTRLSQATLRWEPLKRAIRQGLGNALSCILGIIDKHVDGGIELNSLRLTPEMIKGLYRVDIDLKSNNPSEQNMQMLLWSQQWGKFPRKFIYEKMGFENATQLETEMAAQEIADMPPMRLAQAMEAARLMGLKIQQEAEEAPGGPPGGMEGTPTMGEQMPGIGGSPGLGVPQVSPELLAQNRLTRPLRRMQEAARGQP